MSDINLELCFSPDLHPDNSLKKCIEFIQAYQVAKKLRTQTHQKF